VCVIRGAACLEQLVILLLKHMALYLCCVCVIRGTACYKALRMFRRLLFPLLLHCTTVAVLHFVTNNAPLWAGAQRNCLVTNVLLEIPIPPTVQTGSIFIHRMAERVWLTVSGVYIPSAK
jgi:hypothetical protein